MARTHILDITYQYTHSRRSLRGHGFRVSPYAEAASHARVTLRYTHMMETAAVKEQRPRVSYVHATRFARATARVARIDLTSISCLLRDPSSSSPACKFCPLLFVLRIPHLRQPRSQFRPAEVQNPARPTALSPHVSWPLLACHCNGPRSQQSDVPTHTRPSCMVELSAQQP